jgi:hypothetical protein
MAKDKFKERHIVVMDGLLDKENGIYILIVNGQPIRINTVLDKFVGCQVSFSLKEERDLE